MWIITPPLIAVMFTCYVMFAFTATLHLLDILAIRETLAQCVVPLAGYYDRLETCQMKAFCHAYSDNSFVSNVSSIVRPLGRPERDMHVVCCGP